MPSIQSIVFQPLDESYGQRFDRFIRVPAQTARLIADHGIEGDQKAGHGRSRQLNLIPTDWLAARTAEGYRTGPGEMGEQLIVAGLRFDEMAPGLRLQLGSQVEIELTKSRTGCTRLDAAQPRPLPDAIKLAGIGYMARVITGGVIRVGDPVTILEPQAAG